LQHETGIPNVVDPLGGSHYIESLTDQLVSQSSKLIDEIEALGGMTNAIAQGYPTRAIEESAIHKQARLERGEDIIVGVNKFQVPPNEDSFHHRLLDLKADQIRSIQETRLKEIKESRNPQIVADSLKALENGANSSDNLLHLSIAAMKARCTVGEVSDALEKVFSRHEAMSLSVRGIYENHYKDDPMYKELQEKIESLTVKPKILMAKVGQDGHDRGIKVINAALRDLGFDIVTLPLFQTPLEVVRMAKEHHVQILGISSQAAGHKALIPEIMDLLQGSSIQVICGGIIPESDIPILEKYGVKGIFGPGTSILTVAAKILTIL
jgi:methylmalonyl-CoA mutase